MNKNICQDYGPCKKIQINNFGELTGEWYFISATPVQLKQENSSIIEDIINDNDITTFNGSVIHNPQCNHKHGQLSNDYNKIIDFLEEKSYLVAIFDNKSELFNGQPIAICIDPAITFVEFPNHPHLNSTARIRQSFIPASICYTDDVQGLGSLFGNRIYDAMHYITIWLYRHQVYELFDQHFMKHNWIGNEVNIRLPNSSYFHMINPIGLCHCGSRIKYYECCLNNDAKDYAKLRNGCNDKTTKTIEINPMRLKSLWEKNFKQPEEHVIYRLMKAYNRN